VNDVGVTQLIDLGQDGQGPALSGIEGVEELLVRTPLVRLVGQGCSPCGPGASSR